jgi:hypothetical protein
MEEPGWVIHIVFKGNTSWAKTPLRYRMILVALDFDHPAVLINIELETTAYWMATWWRPGAATGYGIPVLLPTPRLSKVVSLTDSR